VKIVSLFIWQYQEKTSSGEKVWFSAANGHHLQRNVCWISSVEASHCPIGSYGSWRTGKYDQQ